jgi:hypothetical protein
MEGVQTSKNQNWKLVEAVDGSWMDGGGQRRATDSVTDSRLLLLTRPLPGNDEGYEEI